MSPQNEFTGTIENAKQNFLKSENLLHKKIYLPAEENAKITAEYLMGEVEERDKILEKYDFDYTEDMSEFRFFTLVPADYSDIEVEQYISFSMKKTMDNMNEKITTMRNIMMFWFVLSIISMVLSFCMLIGGVL